MAGAVVGRQRKDAEDDKACKDRELARNGNSVHFLACALSKISANPNAKPESVDGLPPVSRLFRPVCKVKACFSHLFDLSRVYANVVSSIIFLATASPSLQQTLEYRLFNTVATAAHLPSHLDSFESPCRASYNRIPYDICPSFIASLLLTARIVSSTIMAALSDRYVG